MNISMEECSEEGVGTYANDTQFCKQGSSVVPEILHIPLGKLILFSMFCFWSQECMVLCVCVWKASYLVHLLMSVECPTDFSSWLCFDSHRCNGPVGTLWLDLYAGVNVP